MGRVWNSMVQRHRRRQINAALRRVSRMDAVTQLAKAERLLLQQINHIDQGSASVDQQHYTIVLHIGLAELYAAAGQTDRARTEYALCARAAGMESGEPQPLNVYLFWLYAQDGRRQRDKEQYERAANQFVIALQLYRHAPEGALTPDEGIELLLDKSDAERKQGLSICAARTVGEAAMLVPEEQRGKKIDLLLRAARLAIQGEAHQIVKDDLDNILTLSAAEPSRPDKAAEANILRALSYRQQERWEESRRTLSYAERLLQENDIQNPDLFYRINHGMAESVKQEDPQQAVRYYLAAGRMALQRAADDERSWDAAQSYQSAAELAKDSGQPLEQILEMLTEAISGLGGITGAPLGMLYSRRGVIRFHLGQFREEYDDYSEAIRCYQGTDALQDMLNLSGIYLNRAETAGRLYGMKESERDFQEAERLLNSIGRQLPFLVFHFSRLYYEWGKQVEVLCEGAPALAEQKYRQALHYAEADLRNTRKERAAVQEMYIRILEHLGGVLYKSGRPAAARQSFQTALAVLEKQPDTDQKIVIRSRLYQRQSDCFAEEGNKREALHGLEQAIAQREILRERDYPVDSVQADAYLSAGQLCEDLAQGEQAAAYFQSAIQRYEKNGKTGERGALANAYYRLGNVQSGIPKHLYTQAMRNFSQAIRLLEEMEAGSDLMEARAIVYRTRGELYANMHEYELARADFERAAVCSGQG